jgi:hypothetical protein
MPTMMNLIGTAMCAVLAVAAQGVPVAASEPQAATDPPPGVYQSVGEGEVLYLTLDERRMVLQNAEGAARIVCRVVREDGLNLYRFGKPMGVRIVAKGGLALEGETAAAVFGTLSYAPCGNPPAPIGWQPYELPATEADPDKRKEVAQELQRRFDLEQRLRQEAMAQGGGRMGEDTQVKPEVVAKWQEIGRVDADNKAWLKDTLLESGLPTASP